MQNEKQVAQVLQQCNAHLGSPTSVKCSSLDQSEVRQHCWGGKAAGPHHSCKPPTTAAVHEGVQCSRMSVSDEADNVPDTNSEWANKEEILSFRKRPLRASTSTDRPLKRSAVSQQQTQPHPDVKHALVQQSVTGGSSSTVASGAAPTPPTTFREAQPSRPTQSYTNEAMDYSQNLQQTAANALAARVLIDMQYDITPPKVQLQSQAATDTQEQAEAPMSAQSDTSLNAQAHILVTQGPVGNAVGDVNVPPDPVGEIYSGHHTAAVVGAYTTAQQQLVARLLHHYTATRGPTWLFC